MTAYDGLILADGPVLYLPLNDASGSTAAALAGSDGTYSGSPTLGVTGPDPVGSTGISTDGTDDYVLAGSNATGLQDAVSIEYWAKWTGTTWQRTFGVIDGDMVLQGGVNTDSAGFSSTAGTVLARRRTGSVSVGRRSSRSDLNDGEWHHVVQVWASAAATADIYVDGVLDNGATTAFGGATAAEFAYPLAFGAENANGTVQNFFGGSLAAPAVYDYELTANKISQHYLGGWGSSQSPMVMG